ncbi:MAG: ZPR1 zinc finger domain-containing protein, partial [Candidatus Hydrothermarchaeota archaeon]|nr:ZPR1 zinc finger domain-containing protein [Candidatus Hydrothermarchaeota archaeon]
MHVDAPCPACEKLGLDVAFHIHEIPYFGDVMENVISCSSCSYRHADVIILETKEPTRYALKVESEEDMLIRVVRSGSAKIEIPELGIKITPGLNSEGYVSNVEGVLARIEDV